MNKINAILRKCSSAFGASKEEQHFAFARFHHVDFNSQTLSQLMLVQKRKINLNAPSREEVESQSPRY